MKLVALALITALSGHFTFIDAKPFTEVIGADVEIFIHVESLSETREAVLAHPFYETFQDEEFLALMDEISGGSGEVDTDEPEFMEVLTEEFGLTLDELFELFPGQAAFAFFNLTDGMAEGDEDPDMALILEYAGEPEKLDELLQIQFERNAAAQKEINPAIEHELKTENFMGETIYLDEVFDGTDTYIEDGYVLVDGIFILASPADRIRTLVEAIKEGASAPLGENASYLRAKEFSESAPELSFYVNLEQIMPTLNELFIESMMSGGMATYGVTSQSLEKALSLNSLLGFYLDLGLEEDGARLDSSLIYSDRSGLLSLMSYKDGLLPEASYIPDDAVSASVSLFDMGSMLSNLEALLNTASPALGPMIDIQMQNMQSQTGVDFRASILENLGSELVSFAVLEPATDDLIMPLAQQFYVIEIKDGDSLGRAFETLKDLVPGGRSFIEEQEFQGETIFTFETPQGPNPHIDPEIRFSYVISRSQLILGYGKIGYLQKMLTDMKDSSAEGIFQDPKVDVLMERLSLPNPVGRSYADMSAFIEPMFKAFSMGGMMGVDNTKLKFPEALKGSFKILSETNQSSDGLFTRALLIKKED